jgi:putative membrane protein
MVMLLGRWFVMAGIVAIAAWIAPGFERGEVTTLGLAALGISAVNVLVPSIVAGLPFPIPMIALAFLYYLVDVLLLRLAGALVPGFGFAGWGGLAVAALLIAVATVGVLAVTGRRRIREV